MTLVNSAPAVTPRQRVLKPEQIQAVFDVFQGIEPEPKGELDYVNAYTLVVAVALSAQATDVSVNAATKALFAKVTTPQQMLDLGEDALKEHIKTIGLYNAKAANVMKAARILVDEYGGEVPEDRAALESLPGVGRKTANVVLQMYWGHPTIAVDTHVFRVSNRMGLAAGNNPDKVEDGLNKRVPAAFKNHAHHWLILHGRYLCKARKPECWRCPVVDWCCFREKTPEPAPKKPKNTSA
ncbi:MAG: endonuclease III [Alphaproteobacteria bacterium TMED89]|nr:endonuclease III [Rhodospirillaceae bacterium]RPH11527.1 MAG: endonuclease III [Alphaproteobacteria bacterium TMED89]